MAKSKERICNVCGTKYTYCGNCATDKSKPVWMNAFDTKECMEVLYAASSYNGKEISKEEAKKRIEKTGMKIDQIKNTILLEQVKEILKSDESSKEVKNSTTRKTSIDKKVVTKTATKSIDKLKVD